jgi:hypothetical protein
LTITLSIFAPSARKMFASKSWVSGRSFCAFHKHRNRSSYVLIDEHHEYLVLVAKENCVAAPGRNHGTNPAGLEPATL